MKLSSNFTRPGSKIYVPQDEEMRHSNFLVTVNLNKRYSPRMSLSNYVAIEDSFAAALEKLGRDPEAAVSIFKSLRHDNLLEKILKIDFTGGIEVSPGRKLIHAHFVIMTEHKTKIQVDYDKVKSYFLQEMGEIASNVYVNVKLLPGSNESVLRYVQKQAYQRLEHADLKPLYDSLTEKMSSLKI